MGVDLLHHAPLDEAAGIMHVKYLLNDRLVNIQHIHLDTADAGGVATAFADYADVVKTFYSSSWSIVLSGLDQVIALDADPLTGVPTRVAVAKPTPAADPVPGESVAVSTAITGLTQTRFVFDTEPPVPTDAGQKFVLRFLGVAASAPGLSLVVSDSAGGTANDQALVALITDGTKPFRARNGLVPIGPARKHTPLDAGERRRMMRK